VDVPDRGNPSGNQRERSQTDSCGGEDGVADGWGQSHDGSLSCTGGGEILAVQHVNLNPGHIAEAGHAVLLVTCMVRGVQFGNFPQGTLNQFAFSSLTRKYIMTGYATSFDQRSFRNGRRTDKSD
jgi:hypothetical protein